MSLNTDVVVPVCANCGKEGDNVNNICNKCKVTTYCNAVCKKVHKKKHKKDCEEHVRLAAERAAKLHDEKLFKQPPPLEDCPICFLRLPSLQVGRRYQSCCGKTICSGCSYAPVYDNQGNEVDDEKCAFCRIPKPATNEEAEGRSKKRVEVEDPLAIHRLGCDYRNGESGLPQDYTKAIELFHRAGALGYAEAYTNIGFAYHYGEGVEADKRKAIYYYELAAVMGSTISRHNLGIEEENSSNYDRALKHYMIAVRGGYSNSLKEIQDLYSNGHAAKEDYMKALQSYQAYLCEIKSSQRDEAAAFDERYRYY